MVKMPSDLGGVVVQASGLPDRRAPVKCHWCVTLARPTCLVMRRIWCRRRPAAVIMRPAERCGLPGSGLTKLDLNSGNKQLKRAILLAAFADPTSCAY